MLNTCLRRLQVLRTPPPSQLSILFTPRLSTLPRSTHPSMKFHKGAGIHVLAWHMPSLDTNRETGRRLHILRRAWESSNICLILQISTMKKVAHPNCVILHEVYDEANKTYLVLDLITGGTVRASVMHMLFVCRVVGRFSERRPEVGR